MLCGYLAYTSVLELLSFHISTISMWQIRKHTQQIRKHTRTYMRRARFVDESLSPRRSRRRTARHTVRDVGQPNALEIAIVSHRRCDRTRTGIVYTDLWLVMYQLTGGAKSHF